MLAQTVLVLVLVAALVGAGMISTAPAGASEMMQEQVVNQPGSGSRTGIVINEVEINPSNRDADRWVELYNPTSSDIDIGNFAIQTSFKPITVVIPAGTVIGSGQFYIVKIDSERFLIAEKLTLVGSSGRIIDTTPPLLDRSNDNRTWQRIPDGSSTWRFVEETPREPNNPDTYHYKERTAPRSSVMQDSTALEPQCLGSALCIEGKVFKIVNTDTLYVRADKEIYKVDLSLTKVSRNDKHYAEGAMITRSLCLGSDVLVDQDDGQTGKGDRNIIGVVYCLSHNINQKLLDSGFVELDPRQCSVSEFANQDWAVRNGCK